MKNKTPPKILSAHPVNAQPPKEPFSPPAKNPSPTAMCVGKGWIEVPEAKLGPNDEITGWAVRRDIWFFALYAQVHIKIERAGTQVSVTRFEVSGTEAAVKHFKAILERAVGLHNQPRFNNMQVPQVRWHMKMSKRVKEARRSNLKKA